MATGERSDPYRGYNFQVQIDGVAGDPDQGIGFRECSGLSLTTDPVEYREGNERSLHPRKLMGLRKSANIVLKRGYTTNKELWQWYKQVLDGDSKNARRNGAIILTDEHQNHVLTWKFENGWICKWEGPAMNATSNDVAIESLEICVERVELED